MRPLGWLLGFAAFGGLLVMSNTSQGATVPSPGLIPARDMTKGEARALIDRWSEQGVIKVIGWERDHVTLGAEVAGVEFRYIDTPRLLNFLDPRMAVLLVRLSMYLHDAYDVTVIHHLGIYPGNPAHPADCHNDGRAIDLSGFSFGDGMADLSVQKDWGSRPYLGPYAPYRLTPEDPGYAFFQDLYAFLAREATDTGWVHNVEPSDIGDTAPPPHYIITPDHSDPALRAAHSNHVHAQIGPT